LWLLVAALAVSHQQVSLEGLLLVLVALAVIERARNQLVRGPLIRQLLVPAVHPFKMEVIRSLPRLPH
jgi:hypothetical protein